MDDAKPQIVSTPLSPELPQQLDPDFYREARLHIARLTAERLLRERSALDDIERRAKIPLGASRSRTFKVEKLGDEFGQFDLILKCEACGHERRTAPRTLANICGWDARLEDVTRRLRCSKCGSETARLKRCLR